jgi:cobalt/nickel transport system permease protein
MFEIFTDIFACRDNALTRIDPRFKVVTALSLLAAIILSDRPWLSMVCFCACSATLVYICVPLKTLCMRLAPAFGLCCMLVGLQSLLSGSTPALTIDLLSFQVVLKKEGFIIGLFQAGRVMGAVSLMLLLSSVTPAYKIFHTLRWLGVPEGWVEIALLVYRYIFCLMDQTSEIICAQRVRLGYGSLKNAFSSLGIVGGAVIVRSMDQAIRTHEAMVVRGYTNKTGYAVLPELGRKNRLVLVAIPIMILVIKLCLDRAV